MIWSLPNYHLEVLLQLHQHFLQFPSPEMSMVAKLQIMAFNRMGAKHLIESYKESQKLIANHPLTIYIHNQSKTTSS